ncbi:MAG: hypothetical protein IPK35_13000 [Saprospiraceae bacterium]|nr:hypothetical protein [Saprospiraceae bacterium]
MFSKFKNLFNASDDKVVEKEALILDVRSKSEFASGHLEEPSIFLWNWWK